MPVLKNWCIEKINKMGKEETRVVRGNVYNSYKFKDGTFSTSSRINSVVNHKDEQKVEVYTQNSIYECHWSDCDVAEGSTLEQVLLETVTRPNYFELMRKCSDGRIRLPKSPELFGMEAVCRQIIEDATNYVENIYLLIDECEDETADELLLAWVKYYLECFRSTETEIWEELFSVFPNKKGHIFKEITRQHLRIYDERNFFVYPQEADIIALPTFWRMCTRDMEELERKQLVIYTIHVMLTKESEKQSVSEIWGIGKNVLKYCLIMLIWILKFGSFF